MKTLIQKYTRAFPGGSVGKESLCNAGDPGSIPGWGRPPGEGREWQPTPLKESTWRIPWTEDPGEIWSMGPQKSDTTE